MPLTLEVVNPERRVVLEDQVDSIILPGYFGQMQILEGHVNMMTLLTSGTFAYQVKGESEYHWAVLSGGFAQVTNGKVAVLAEDMQLLHEIEKAKLELRHTEIEHKLRETQTGTVEYDALLEELRYIEHADELNKMNQS